MKIVLQRVSRAAVRVKEELVGKIGRGLLLLVAVEKGDSEEIIDTATNKVLNLRIFPDDGGKMNLSSLDEKVEILVVSQFTLAGNLERGRRPSFERAAAPEMAKTLFERFVDQLIRSGLKVETGRFRAMMDVELVNDGPVTFVLEIPGK